MTTETKTVKVRAAHRLRAAFGHALLFAANGDTPNQIASVRLSVVDDHTMVLCATNRFALIECRVQVEATGAPWQAVIPRDAVDIACTLLDSYELMPASVAFNGTDCLNVAVGESSVTFAVGTEFPPVETVWPDDTEPGTSVHVDAQWLGLIDRIENPLHAPWKLTVRSEFKPVEFSNQSGDIRGIFMPVRPNRRT